MKKLIGLTIFMFSVKAFAVSNDCEIYTAAINAAKTSQQQKTVRLQQLTANGSQQDVTKLQASLTNTRQNLASLEQQYNNCKAKNRI